MAWFGMGCLFGILLGISIGLSIDGKPYYERKIKELELIDRKLNNIQEYLKDKG